MHALSMIRDNLSVHLEPLCRDFLRSVICNPMLACGLTPIASAPSVSSSMERIWSAKSDGPSDRASRPVTPSMNGAVARISRLSSRWDC
jgi:hypothetical protein